MLVLSLLIVFVGNSSLNVTLPTLSRDLHATTSELQWVVAIYSLVFAGLLFTTGALGDRYGRKGALQSGLLLFLVAAGLAARSNAMWQLIACRAVMGAAAALIMPSTLSILINVFPANERAKAIAIWASFTGAAGAIGPVVSGWLLGHFWFGSVFLVNVPIILVALVAGFFLVPDSRDPEEASLDPVGAILSIIGIVALVYGLIEAPDKGWSSTMTLGAFGLSVIVLTIFALWELRVENPMLDIRYFRNPSFSVGTGGMILVFLGMYGVLFLITQYFQLVLNLDPLQAALRTLPMSPIMLIVAPMTPRLTRRFGVSRTVGAGMVLVSIGLLMFAGIGLHTPYIYIAACLTPFVVGLALSMSPMTSAIMSAVPSRRAGAGSAMNDAARELGAALGVAILGSIAASKYGTKLARLVVGLPPASRQNARSSLTGALNEAGHLPLAAGAALRHGARVAFLDGMHLACFVGSVLALIAAGVVLRYLPGRVAEDIVIDPANTAEAADDVALGNVGIALAHE